MKTMMFLKTSRRHLRSSYSARHIFWSPCCKRIFSDELTKELIIFWLCFLSYFDHILIIFWYTGCKKISFRCDWQRSKMKILVSTWYKFLISIKAKVSGTWWHQLSCCYSLSAGKAVKLSVDICLYFYLQFLNIFSVSLPDIYLYISYPQRWKGNKFRNICLSVQSLFLSEAGEVGWVATFKGFALLK